MHICTLVAQHVCMHIDFFSKLSSRPRYEHSPSASVVSVFSILGSLNNCELLYYILEKAKPKQLHQSPRRNQGGRGKHSVSFPRMMMVGNMLYSEASLALLFCFVLIIIKCFRFCLISPHGLATFQQVTFLHTSSRYLFADNFTHAQHAKQRVRRLE